MRNPWAAQQQQAADANRERDSQIADNQQQEATLKAYLDGISDLLLNHNLGKSKPSDEVSQVARVQTLTALRRLDAYHNKVVLQFLQDAHLIGFTTAALS